jgi:hypothetical protein
VRWAGLNCDQFERWCNTDRLLPLARNGSCLPEQMSDEDEMIAKVWRPHVTAGSFPGRMLSSSCPCGGKFTSNHACQALVLLSRLRSGCSSATGKRSQRRCSPRLLVLSGEAAN